MQLCRQYLREIVADEAFNISRGHAQSWVAKILQVRNS
jgi:hypothetical protein